jgi:sugar phosphate isomerase/epimerase
MTGFDRRSLLRGTGMIGMMALLGGCSRLAAGEDDAAQPFFTRIGKPIGLQLYALGDELTADIPGVLKTLAGMGYGEVELPNLLGKTAPELRAMADAAGLTIACLHIPAMPFAPSDGLTFQSSPDEIADVAGELGISHVVLPFPILPAGFAPGAGEDFPTAISRAFGGVGLDHWRMVAARFNEIGAAMKARGLQLAYHNHNLEFAPLEGTTPWNVLMAETDAELVKVQLDLGWVATAGLDPVAELGKLAGRVVSVHVKDVAADNRAGFYFGTSPAAVGSGTIDWKAVLPACEAAGAQHYFVEQEPPFTTTRVEAAAQSAAFLKAVTA